jgi:response regulator RpfG family c-di-GMP phosphodiesterase
MTDNILFVDDEENILAAFRRQLRKQFSLETAKSGQEGLEMLRTNGPFAVVVADLRMPGMDGIQFLTRVKEISPDTIRMMLTGHADLSTAIDAVNEGNIFRFLTKPCPVDALVKATQNGLQQYRLVTAERDLLEKTLNQSINLLTEVLCLANPIAFNRTLRLRKVVKHIVQELKLYDGWQVELAAMLSLTGYVVLPPSLLNKINTMEPLTKNEQNMFFSYPFIGYRLLKDIPRLESIANMVKDQQKRFCDYASSMQPQSTNKVDLGAQILKVALDYDDLIQCGISHIEAIRILKTREGDYNPNVVNIFGENEILINSYTVKMVDVNSVVLGMILDEDVITKKGEILVSKRQEVTEAVIERLQLISLGTGVVEPFRVLVSGINKEALIPIQLS